MVSENIHVNAFVYEPIIDMSDDELISLYEIVKKCELIKKYAVMFIGISCLSTIHFRFLDNLCYRPILKFMHTFVC